jgi:hypothetical protein
MADSRVFGSRFRLMKIRNLGMLCVLTAFVALDSAAEPVKKKEGTVKSRNEVADTNPHGKKNAAPQGQSSDSTAYLKAAAEAEKLRVKRRVSAEEFVKMARDPGTVILDARSAQAYEQLRIKGSVNLPYTDMGAESLAKVIPTKKTRVLIYCRNNLLGENPLKSSDTGAFPVTPSTPTVIEEKDGHRYPTEFEQPQIPKTFGAGLNIPTYITLYIYGYRNVWELDPVVDPNRTVIEFESEKRAQP